MLTHPTLTQLDELGLAGMAKAFAELQDNPEVKALDHAEWLALLLDREVTQRKDRRLKSRLRAAKLRSARPASRISISPPAAAWIGASWPSWRPATGFVSTTI
jgi:DNA replication protein DnaC